MSSELTALNAGMTSMTVNPPVAQIQSQPIQSPDIKSFNKNTEDLHGFSKTSDVNLKRNISKKEKAKGSSHDFSHFGVGSRPSVRGHLIASGTDDPEATQHFLTIVDGETMLNDASKSPVVTYVKVSEHMSDVKWLNSSTILASTGRGNLQLFQFDGKEVKHIGDMKDAAGSYTREIAVQPGVPSNVVIGGFDQKLNFLDLNRPENPYVQRIDMQSVIGSIKWSPFNANSYVSCTLDEGKYYLFDSRQKITQSAFFIDLKEDDLFCHERYNDFNCLLGFGNGKIKHIDMRQPKKILHTEQDPYCEAIGGIDYNHTESSFVVSGYTDFSVYKVKNGEAQIWSHSKSGDATLRGKGWNCGTAWYDKDTVVMTDSEGGLGLFIQDFV